MEKKKRLRNLIIPVGIILSAGLIWFFERRWDRRFLISKSEDIGIKDSENWLQVGRLITVRSLLPCSPNRIWEQVRTSGLMMHVNWPVLSFREDDSELPAIWTEGKSQDLRLYAFGIIPLGKHNIYIERIDPEAYILQSREIGQIAQIWNHTIKLTLQEDGQTLYSDVVRIYAGKMTSLVAFFAKLLYRYRQTRLQKLADALC